MDLIYLVCKGSRMSAILLESYGLADWGEAKSRNGQRVRERLLIDLRARRECSYLSMFGNVSADINDTGVLNSIRPT